MTKYRNWRNKGQSGTKDRNATKQTAKGKEGRNRAFGQFGLSEFAAPPGEKVSAPDTTPSSSSSNSSSRWAHLGDPLEAGDIMYTKQMAQEE
ncbi:hypothetical protein niasHT_002459 [Heterodera trifolii]|uniref:Uncharacterized protein n=1 Tax=Heterodera trifolii TaxID=157864 RepID=A0ABD2LMC3_9BILA